MDVNENISGSDIDVLNVSNWLSTADIVILDKKSQSIYNNISQSIIKKWLRPIQNNQKNTQS